VICEWLRTTSVISIRLSCCFKFTGRDLRLNNLVITKLIDSVFFYKMDRYKLPPGASLTEMNNIMGLQTELLVEKWGEPKSKMLRMVVDAGLERPDPKTRVKFWFDAFNDPQRAEDRSDDQIPEKQFIRDWEKHLAGRIICTVAEAQIDVSAPDSPLSGPDYYSITMTGIPCCDNCQAPEGSTSHSEKLLRSDVGDEKVLQLLEGIWKLEGPNLMCLACMLKISGALNFEICFKS
jgi:hypothetical protein